MNEQDVVSDPDASPSITCYVNMSFSKFTRGIHTDCLLNYETIKYFGGEQHEGDRYRESLRLFQVYQYKLFST